MNDATLPDLAMLPMLRRDGGADPVELLATCLARIAAGNDTLRAVIALDRDGAERAANDAADRWRRGAARSPIDGAPVLVKANIAVAGLPWHAGIAAYRDRVAAADAPAVARLRAAGAVVLGLTNMDEGALGAAGDNPWLGRIGNPQRPGLSAGGSSGGSAAAVAAGFCLAALGSDTIGSIAIPAACCGVAGHRASRGVMPVTGFVPLAPRFDHAGWHTRSTGGALALREALGAAAGTTRPLRIAALSLDGAERSPDVDAALSEAVERARSAGWPVDRVALPVALDDVARRLFEVAEADAAVVHRRMLRDRPDGFSPGFRRMLDWGAGRGAERRDDHLAAIARAAAAVGAALAGYDALLMPATPHRGFAAGAPPPADLARFAALPACLGWPATTIPPSGAARLALTVAARSDDTCLTIAHALA